jgi:hypothetical protein
VSLETIFQVHAFLCWAESFLEGAKLKQAGDDDWGLTASICLTGANSRRIPKVLILPLAVRSIE